MGLHFQDKKFREEFRHYLGLNNLFRTTKLLFKRSLRRVSIERPHYYTENYSEGAQEVTRL